MSTNSFRKTAYTKMFIAILISMTLTTTLSITSVKASPITMTISPNSGSVGETVTISGDEASADGEVRVYVGVFFVAFFVATTRANSTGSYSVNITVPAVPAGTYTIIVHDIETGDTNTDTFTIQPKIILTPEEGSGNDAVTVEGYGFNSGSSITLEFDGNDVTPMPQPSTDDFGSFRARFVVPSTPNGTYTVNASDGTNNALAQFTVIPKITLSPKTSGPTGTLVAVNGNGFAESVAVTVEFDTINVTAYPQGFTSSDGSFMQVFFVPDVPDGTYTVNAIDEFGNSADAPFTVPSPVITLTPNMTSGFSIVTVTGSGFPSHQPIFLYLESALMVNLLDLMTESQTLFADEYGSYEYSFIVPVTKPGVYTVAACSVGEGDGLAIGEKLASASLTIVEDALLVDIKDEIATIIIPDLGAMKANLTDLNAKIIGINGTVAIIETDLGTVKADLTTINARVVSIDGNVATIETDVGTIKTDVSGIQAEVVPTGFELGLVTTILGLIAAIGAWLSAILIKKKQMPIA